MTNAEVVIQGLAGGVISGALGLLIWHIKQQRSDLSEFQKMNDVYLRKICGDIEQVEKDDIRRDARIESIICQISETKGSIETLRRDLKDQSETIVKAMGKIDAAFRLLPNANQRASDMR